MLTSRVASTSYLQRRLSLGYTRAARIIDQLEAARVIGPQQGAKAREILQPSPMGAFDGEPELKAEAESA